MVKGYSCRQNQISLFLVENIHPSYLPSPGVSPKEKVFDFVATVIRNCHEMYDVQPLDLTKNLRKYAIHELLCET